MWGHMWSRIELHLGDVFYIFVHMLPQWFVFFWYLSQWCHGNMWALTLISPTAELMPQWLYPQKQQKTLTVHPETLDFFGRCTMGLGSRLCCGNNFPPVCSFFFLSFSIPCHYLHLTWCGNYALKSPPPHHSSLRAARYRAAAFYGFDHFNKRVDQRIAMNLDFSNGNIKFILG